MSFAEVANWLVSCPGFLRRYNDLCLDASLIDVRSHSFSESDTVQKDHDWSYLLLCASTLANSDTGDCQAAALRIAQACMLSRSTSAHQRLAAAHCLDGLANNPAIDLAVERRLLSPEFHAELPAGILIDNHRRRIENEIRIGDDISIRGNRFQTLFWNMASQYDWLSVSAPTSAGKSYIIAQYVSLQLSLHPSATVIYIVPTRALISQVEKDLQEAVGRHGIPVSQVTSIPGELDQDQGIYVLTQERLHLLLASNPNVSANLLLIDEAHKISDPQRGYLLQEVFERLIQNSRETKVILASPMTLNPEVLLQDAPGPCSTAPLTTEAITVIQNIHWLRQIRRKPREWTLHLLHRGHEAEAGAISLGANPSSARKRLAFLSHAIGNIHSGNIVYVNGAAEAEKVSALLYDLQDRTGISDDTLRSELDDLIELVKHVIHRDCILATFLSRGIAYHYGNMPLIVREHIELLFSKGSIQFLVCTSTLIEGVNLACKNVFMRGPQRGRGNNITEEDFWNLAGRAGRWGREFQGNVFCVDPDDAKLWGDDGPPRERVRLPIHRAVDRVLFDSEDLLAYIQNGRDDFSRDNANHWTPFGYLCSVHCRLGSISAAPWAHRAPPASINSIGEAVAEAVQSISVDSAILSNNPGVTPYGLDSLLQYFLDNQDRLGEMIPSDPSSYDTLDNYTSIFSRMGSRGSPNLSEPNGRAYMLALLVCKWMRGYPLRRLIEERIQYLSKRNGTPPDTAKVIREVMADVDQIARFEAPKSLRMYSAVLKQALLATDQPELASEVPELETLMEFGVAQTTQMSLIGLGLSRTTAIGISEFIAADDLDREAALDWLIQNRSTWSYASIPNLIKAEVVNLIDRRSSHS